MGFDRRANHRQNIKYHELRQDFCGRGQRDLWRCQRG